MCGFNFKCDSILCECMCPSELQMRQLNLSGHFSFGETFNISFKALYQFVAVIYLLQNQFITVARVNIILIYKIMHILSLNDKREQSDYRKITPLPWLWIRFYICDSFQISLLIISICCWAVKKTSKWRQNHTPL